MARPFLHQGSLMADIKTLPPARILPPERFKAIDFALNTWVVTLPVYGELEDILLPKFWSKVTGLKQMKAGDLVIARTDDHRFIAEAYVRAVKPEVLVEILRAHKIGVDVTAPDQFAIDWNETTKSFDVKRKDTKSTIKAGSPTREAAAEWLREHIRAMAA